MKKILQIFFIELISSLILAFLGNNANFGYDFMTIFGLINLLLGGIGILGSLIALLIKGNENSKNFLAASGLLILVGLGTCSVFPFRLH